MLQAKCQTAVHTYLSRTVCSVMFTFQTNFLTGAELTVYGTWFC